MVDSSPQVDAGKKRMISELGILDFEQLSDDQIRMVDSVAVSRVNSNALKRVGDAMKDKEDAILGAMTTAPFVYTSDDIEIFPKLVVRFSSTLSSQEIDAKEAINEVYSADETIDLASARVNLISLVHGLSYINGDPCGGIGLNPSLASDKEHLKAIRETRIKFLLAQPAHVIDRIVEFHRAFQLQINSLTRDQKLLERLGN